MEENTIRIVEWPKDPVAVQVGSLKGNPLEVNMNMRLNNNEQVPLCIRLCEPICAESKYKIGINLLGQPFAEILIEGVTRLVNCKERDSQLSKVNVE